MDTKNEHRGREQLKTIIGEIMDNDKNPSWDFLNGVLSCEKVLGDTQLWFWFGDLRIVTLEDREKQRKSGVDSKMIAQCMKWAKRFNISFKELVTEVQQNEKEI